MTQEENTTNKYNISVAEMTQSGVNFGHKTSRLHPKMDQYLLGVRNMVHIIDLEKTTKKFEELLDVIKNLVSEEKVILFVGTKIQSKDIVKEVAEELDFPYVNERWLGGMFTNFEVIKKRVDYFKKLEEEEEKGDWEKYTKKEQIKLKKELSDLKRKFGGIKNMEKLPDAVFVVDMNDDDLAIKEARSKGILIFAIADTNSNPDLADYIVPANDDSILSIKYILNKVREVAKIEKK